MPKKLTPQGPEPAPGSVLLTSSLTGTAVQRFYADGKYHSTTGEVSDFAGLFVNKSGTSRDVFLIHDASEH